MRYVLKLSVTGETPQLKNALRNLKKILEDELKGLYTLKVVDVLRNPKLAEEDKILATPAVSRVLPAPIRKIIGDLSDKEKVLLGLDLAIERRAGL